MPRSPGSNPALPLTAVQAQVPAPLCLSLGDRRSPEAAGGVQRATRPRALRTVWAFTKTPLGTPASPIRPPGFRSRLQNNNKREEAKYSKY